MSKILKWIVYIAVIISGIGVGIIAGFSFCYIRDLPSLDLIINYQEGHYWGKPSRIYDYKGRLIGELGYEYRKVVTLDKLPKHIIKAVLAAEDARFFKHFGVDIYSIARAIWVNIKKKRIVQGGSTITQQLVKNLFLSPQKTLKRKWQELILALVLEYKLSKEEILERYLNKVYFGHGIYGIAKAAEFYFSATPQDLSLAESALLAGLIRAPNFYSPFVYRKRALLRRNYVLQRMYELRFISADEYKTALKEPISTNKRKQICLGVTRSLAPYFVEYLRRKLEETYGAEAVYRGGLHIYTPLDLDLQIEAQNTLTLALRRLNSKLSPKVGKIEGLLLAVEANSGYIRAMVGGSGFSRYNQLNRVFQIRRQPGSAFKPIIYAAALEHLSLTPIDILEDKPTGWRGRDGKLWRPQNYNGIYYGSVTVRRALELSLNSATIHLLNKLSPKIAWNFATMLGITREKPKYLDLSLALGCYEVVPAELINAYVTFCNNGVYFPLISILKIYDNHNNLLEEHIPVGRRVISEESAYILTHLLKGVVERGTAHALRGVFPCEVAAKTGTSDTYADAWFIGYTPDLVVGVWVGNDSQRISLGPDCSGAVIALPIWKEFLLNAVEKNILSFKKKKFDVPPQIKFYKICSQSKALARQGCPEKIEEAFSTSKFNSLFLSYCDIHSGLPADYNIEEEVEENLTPSEELSYPY